MILILLQSLCLTCLHLVMTKLGYFIAGKVVEVKSKDDLINNLETNVIVL